MRTSHHLRKATSPPPPPPFSLPSAKRVSASCPVQSISSVSLAPASTVSSGGTDQSFQPHLTAGGNPPPSASRNAPEPPGDAPEPPGDPLPGVCYITYPPTPDLASSCCTSLGTFDGHTSVDGQSEEGDTTEATLQHGLRRQSSSASFQDDGDSPVPDTSPAANVNPERRKTSSSSSSSNIAGNRKEGGRRPDGEVERHQQQQGHRRKETRHPAVCANYGIENPGDWPGLAFDGERPSSPKDHQRAATEPQKSRSTNEGGLRLPSDTIANRQAISTGAIGGRGRPDKGRVGGGQISIMRRCRAKGGRSRLIKTIAPSIPGVDEHQQPPFRLAEMHENMRRDR